MKIVARPEYEDRFICLWVGNFADLDELLALGEKVLRPAFAEEDYDFDSVAEFTIRSDEPTPAELLRRNFYWQVYDADAVCAVAGALGMPDFTGYVAVNHARCEAGPRDFPGLTFLGTFPSQSNPAEPWADD